MLDGKYMNIVEENDEKGSEKFRVLSVWIGKLNTSKEMS